MFLYSCQNSDISVFEHFTDVNKLSKRANIMGSDELIANVSIIILLNGWIFLKIIINLVRWIVIKGGIIYGKKI